MILGARVKFLVVMILFVILSAAEAGAAWWETDPNLVAWWECDNAADNNIVTDSSGNGYNGTSVRNTSVLHTTGKIGGALAFNGTGDYIDTGNTFRAVFRDSFTISLWAKPTDGHPATDQGILGNLDYYEVFFELYITGVMGVGLATGPSWIVASASNVFSDGEQPWTMITFVGVKLSAISGYALLYVDGILVNTGTTVPITWANFSASANIRLGQSIPGNFVGSIDDVKIFSRALSADEVRQLYGAGFIKQKQQQYFRRNQD
jgi:hypothetical protein